MDFFEAQERARKRTHRLVLLFVLAVAGTILASYAVAIVVLQQSPSRARWRGRHAVYEQVDPAPFSYWNPQVFTGIVVGTLVIVGGASLYKW